MANRHTRPLAARAATGTLEGIVTLTADDVLARVPRAERITDENIAEVSRRHAHPATDSSAWGNLRSGDFVWAVANPSGADLAVLYMPRDGKGPEGAYGRNGTPPHGGGRFAGPVRIEGASLVLRDEARSVDLDMVTGRVSSTR